jgi:hypothetical protein
MPRVLSPKFSLADVMVLIGATGFGLGGYIVLDNQIFSGKRYLFGLLEPPPRGWTSILMANRAAGVLASMLVLFGAWTFALPILGLRRARPIRRRINRGPGMTACLATLAGMATAIGVGGFSFGLRQVVDGSITLPANFLSRGLLFDNMVIFAGVGVTTAWAVLLATSRWRPTRDGFDRLGRFLGGLWIASALVFATRLLLQ